MFRTRSSRAAGSSSPWKNSPGYGTKLYALNAATGKTEWSAGLGGTYGFSALTYDGQRLFALNGDGVLTAFTAATGHEVWVTALPGHGASASPIAYDGVVYVTLPTYLPGSAVGLQRG
jgi:outer membrane protein assembly factor BamB